MTEQDFDTNDSMNPDLDDLLQRQQDGELHAPVKVIGPVRTTRLPARLGFSRSLAINNAAGLCEGIAADPRRAYFIIYCTDQPIYLGHSKQSVLDGSAAILDTFFVLELATSDEIWIRGTNAAVSNVHYFLGQWAD